MNFLDNIVVSNISGIMSEREEPAVDKTKTHINYITKLTKLNKYEL